MSSSTKFCFSRFTTGK
ncbi:MULTISPECIES: peptide IlvX [Enterobacteriaceae]|uniref:Peptide IlvX n=2 Tax=Leclercia TaxID=83654 RepID=A0A9X4BFK1_9ENTR|nr:MULTISPECIES: peptide IlvX [Enterobacteriaceae]MCT9846651.1 peptide IlvX [Leclercia adecarboxylata ATCC 23216 = NBRC 102595]MBK0352736.1 hypothetical protein [Leclercia adecarboxylata]MBM6636592.1 peptide IlvX [Leclercia adecarboxylata]MBZ3802539.1 peptide IlvX [Leclercia adecarboxylata]MBZ3807104.1 peptide IlvX [Leclercia adecarboxylata]